MVKKKRGGVIRTSYEIISPESAAEGEADESGWEDEEGVRLSPAEAVTFLHRAGIGRYSPSSSSFHKGVWYTTEPDQDYRTGDWETRSYHLSGYTPAQEKRIYEGVVKGHYRKPKKSKARRSR